VRRWQVEVTFHEIRTHLGAETPQLPCFVPTSENHGKLTRVTTFLAPFMPFCLDHWDKVWLTPKLQSGT
jgi:hypothetical protein